MILVGKSEFQCSLNYAYRLAAHHMKHFVPEHGTTTPVSFVRVNSKHLRHKNRKSIFFITYLLFVCDPGLRSTMLRCWWASSQRNVGSESVVCIVISIVCVCFYFRVDFFAVDDIYVSAVNGAHRYTVHTHSEAGHVAFEKEMRTRVDATERWRKKCSLANVLRLLSIRNSFWFLVPRHDWCS